jgi:hypothetical protein
MLKMKAYNHLKHGNYLPSDTASHPNRPEFSTSRLLESYSSMLASENCLDLLILHMLPASLHCKFMNVFKGTVNLKTLHPAH